MQTEDRRYAVKIEDPDRGVNIYQDTDPVAGGFIKTEARAEEVHAYLISTVTKAPPSPIPADVQIETLRKQVGQMNNDLVEFMNYVFGDE
jgi:hypothetical protein